MKGFRAPRGIAGRLVEAGWTAAIAAGRAGGAIAADISIAAP